MPRAAKLDKYILYIKLPKYWPGAHICFLAPASSPLLNKSWCNPTIPGILLDPCCGSCERLEHLIIPPNTNTTPAYEEPGQLRAWKPHAPKAPNEGSESAGTGHTEPWLRGLRQRPHESHDQIKSAAKRDSNHSLLQKEHVCVCICITYVCNVM